MVASGAGRMKHAAVTLDDKYDTRLDRIYLTGTQALVRLLLTQARLDRARGWHTAGFASGYRGSPLGAVDTAFWRASKAFSSSPL